MQSGMLSNNWADPRVGRSQGLAAAFEGQSRPGRADLVRGRGKTHLPHRHHESDPGTSGLRRETLVLEDATQSLSALHFDGPHR